MGRLSRKDVLRDKRLFWAAIPGTTPESPSRAFRPRVVEAFGQNGLSVSRARSSREGFLNKLNLQGHFKMILIRESQVLIILVY